MFFLLLVCLIIGWVGMGKIIIVFEVVYFCVDDILDWLVFNSIIWVSVDWKGLSFSDFLNIIVY